MEEKRIDARGLACPEPVVLTRKAILEPGVICVSVLVDSEISSENIQRLAQSRGWDSRVEEHGREVRLILTRPATAAAADTADAQLGPQREAAANRSGESPTVVVLITSSLFGVGDERLGQILMKSFLKTLKDLDTLPAHVIFANSGVKLTAASSDLVEVLRDLEGRGVGIMSCGTCLDYYGLVDSLAVGAASNMYEIASLLVQADRIVRP